MNVCAGGGIGGFIAEGDVGKAMPREILDHPAPLFALRMQCDVHASSVIQTQAVMRERLSESADRKRGSKALMICAHEGSEIAENEAT